ARADAGADFIGRDGWGSGLPLREPLRVAKSGLLTAACPAAQLCATNACCAHTGTNGFWWTPGTSNPAVGRDPRPRWVRFPRVPASFASGASPDRGADPRFAGDRSVVWIAGR